MTRSHSQCPTSSTSCLTLAGQCPQVIQAQVSTGTWEGRDGGLCPPEGPRYLTRCLSSPLPQAPCLAVPQDQPQWGFSLSGKIQLCVQHPQDWAGLCLAVSGPLLCLWFLQLKALFWVHIPLFNFSSFSPCTLFLLFSLQSPPTFSILPSLFFSCPPPADLLEI